MNPTVTVVIPFNDKFTPRSFLREAIASVENQSVPTTIEVLEDEMGPAYGRNQGLDRAETRFVAFIDADDLWKPGKLKQQLDLLEETQAGLSVEAPSGYSTPEIVRELLIGDLESITSSILLDRQAISTRFREDFIRYEDHMFIVEAGLETEFAPVPNCVQSRKHKQGMSHQGSVQENLEATRKLYNQLCKILPNQWPYRGEILSTLGYNVTRLNQRCHNYSEAVRWGIRSLRVHGWNSKTIGLLALLPVLYANNRIRPSTTST